MGGALTLVTGATGFVGTRLVKALLERGRSVRGFAHTANPQAASPESGSSFELIRGDLLDADSVDRAVGGCETVFHCGAVVPGRDSEERTWAVNVTGTAHVVDACVRHGVRRLIYVSTDSVYGDGPTVDATEDSPLSTDYFKEGNYPLSKLEGERLVQRAAKEHRLDTVMLRPCMIYGPGPSPATELFAEWSSKRVKYLLGSGRSRLSVLYVDDLVEALLLAETAPRASGQCFNVSDGQVYAKREIVDRLVALCGRPTVVVSVPGPPLQTAFTMLQPIARLVAPALAAGVDVRRVLFAIQDHTINCGKAIDVLGYRPKVLLPEGLARTVAWLTQHPAGGSRAH